MTLPSPKYTNMCKFLMYLEDSQKTAEILKKLIVDSEDPALMAYQMAFDMHEDATIKCVRY